MLASSHLPKKLIVYADDDIDDRFLFEDVLKDLPVSLSLTMVNNGQQLIELLNQADCQLPSALFLDMNMPRMNGLECLLAIKASSRLKVLPVIMLTTSLSTPMIKELHDHGADYYIQKPNSAVILTQMISLALSLVSEAGNPKTELSEFILKPKV